MGQYFILIQIIVIPQKSKQPTLLSFHCTLRHLCLSVSQVLWKSYIDFEIEQEEFGNTRNLYKRLLQRTQHVKVGTALHKVWILALNLLNQVLLLLEMWRREQWLNLLVYPAGLDQLCQVRAVDRQPRAAAEVPADLRGSQQGHEELRGKGGAAHAARVLEGLREGVWLRQHPGESQETAAR